MIARAIPFAGIASWNAFASSGGIGFVFRSMRGLREKIWIASAPTAVPRSGASAMLSAIETWAPRYIAPPAGIASAQMSLPMSLAAATGATNRGWTLSRFRPVGRGECPRLHDQIRERQVVLPLRERIRELLPPPVLDPFSHDRVAEEQLDLPQLVEERHGRVDAREGDVEAVVLEQVRHRVFVEGPLGTPSGLLPVVPVMAAEDERPSRTEGTGRMPDDLRRHAEVADDRIDWVAGEFMVGRLVDVAEDEFDVRNIPDARICPSMHEFRAVEVHTDDASAGRRSDEGEPPFARADVQDELSAKVLMPELIQKQRTERVGLLRRLPPWKRAAHAHDVRHDVLAPSQRMRGIRGHRCGAGKATRL